MGFFAGLFAGANNVSSDGHWLTRIIAPLSHAGTAVNEQRALQLTAVYAAVGILADGLAQLPVDSFQKKRDGRGRDKRPDAPATRLLGEAPNPFMTAFSFRNALQAHGVTWGNGFAEIQRNGGGDPIGLWPLLPDRTRPVTERQEDGQVRLFYETSVDGQYFRLPPEDVLHIPGMGFDGIRGYSPIQLARNAVGLGLALEEFGSKFFANDAKSGGVIEHPGKLSEQAKQNLRESHEMQSGLSNAHRVKILEEGMQFKNISIPPEDAQFIKTREFQTEEIARLYRIPLFMLQSHAKDTSWGTGIAEQSLGFLRYTLEPWLIRWEQEVNRKLFTDAERRAGMFFKHNVAGLLRPDPAGRAAFYTQALDPKTGWLLRDEVRELEDRNPLEMGIWDAENAGQDTDNLVDAPTPAR